MVLEKMANLGLQYFMFLVEVELELAIIKRTGKKVVVIAHCVLGRVAMASALVNDIYAWIILSIAIALDEKDTLTMATFGVLGLGVSFVLLCIFVIRPAINWVIKRTPEGENFNEVYVSLILTGVMICGFTTDVIGTHSIFEDLFVSGLLLPVVFAISGLRTDIGTIHQKGNHAGIMACVAQVGVTLLAFYYQMSFHEGIALGLLMNTKGPIEIIVLNVGRDQKENCKKAQTHPILTDVEMLLSTVSNQQSTIVFPKLKLP
ncbi:hypothetical protein IFM89_030845 [Coptis chinensis]|uniref:Cation/H+ exchanger transmembrane domain-containing protein n=1 Tax=Coptis chinensis TaxID=261450 RepID=A0A835H1X0_9MAGN|nr:hypothetical protein IFM89_030845 [Coptis chinensis]